MCRPESKFHYAAPRRVHMVKNGIICRMEGGGVS